MTVEALAGRAFGPAACPAAPGRVAGFVAATGDDAGRWSRFAPPGFAAVALFAVVPELLGDPAVAGSARSLLHAEQAFTWARPLAVGEELAVTGRVAGVRRRGELHLVFFETAAAGTAGLWMEGLSTFLVSAEAAAAASDEDEPPAEARARFAPASPIPLPAAGEALPVLHRSASRADLARYAAATGDHNPIHTDHAAARAAGLPGVIAHGLLLAAWLFQAAARLRPGPHPLQSARVRFRRPLRPGVAATITGRVAAAGESGAELHLNLETAGDPSPLATAELRVTP
jgi:acyl dehydratase